MSHTGRCKGARFHPCKEECSPCPSFKGGTQKPAGAFRLVLLQNLISGASTVFLDAVLIFLPACTQFLNLFLPTGSSDLADVGTFSMFN